MTFRATVLTDRQTDTETGTITVYTATDSPALSVIN